MAQPPRCYVCGFGLRDIPPEDDFRDHLTAVYFTVSPEVEELIRNRPYIPPEQRFIGHDPTLYFCRRHAPLALERQSMYEADALAEIRELTADEVPYGWQPNPTDRRTL